MSDLINSNQYLSIDPRRGRLPRPQTAHKLQKIVDMNAYISETIEDRELGFQIFRSLVRSASLLREHATPTNAHKPTTNFKKFFII